MTASPPPLGRYGRPLLQLAREIDRHLATLHRWRQYDVLDPNGIRQRLPMRKIGGRWYVQDGDFAAFMTALAGESTGTGNGQPAVSPDARSKQFGQIGRELDAAGIK